MKQIIPARHISIKLLEVSWLGGADLGLQNRFSPCDGSNGTEPTTAKLRF
jgi:hypothetical protein